MSTPQDPGPTRPHLPPREVVWATYAMYAAIAFSLVSLAVRVVDPDGDKGAVRDPNASRYTAAVASAVVVTLGISAAYVFLAVNLRRGVNRARITTWIVLAVLTLLGLLMLASDVPAAAHVFDVLVVLANVAALVLLAVRPSGRFFAATKQHPQF